MKPRILRSGTLAYFDSLAGLIPVRIISIQARQPDRGETRPSSEHEVVARVTADCRQYRCGDRVRGWSLHFVPRPAIRQAGRVIGAYTVEVDPEINEEMEAA